MKTTSHSDKTWEEKFDAAERATAGEYEEVDKDGLGALRGFWSAIKLMAAIIGIGWIVSLVLPHIMPI